MTAHSYPLISVILASYNRSDYLKRSLDAFWSCCTYPNLELIVSDDGSSPEHVQQILKLPVDRIVFAKKNQGLGANNNQGLRQAKGDYIFYLQDDFLCHHRGDFMQDALEILQTHEHVGLVKMIFEDTWQRYETCYTQKNHRLYQILSNQQPASSRHIYIYSDSPHLKKRDFHTRLGNYREGLPVGQTEEEFCKRFLEKNVYQIAQLDARQNGVQLFDHGDMIISTRPEHWRVNMRARLMKSRLGQVGVRCYQKIPVGMRHMLHTSYWNKASNKKTRA